MRRTTLSPPPALESDLRLLRPRATLHQANQHTFVYTNSRLQQLVVRMLVVFEHCSSHLIELSL